MGKINVMSENLANKIAAGEVVERIANVVKELVENAIDAKSSKISIDLIDSGVKEIKVIDNGSGMDKEDATLAFSRHATSKLSSVSDLFNINSLPLSFKFFFDRDISIFFKFLIILVLVAFSKLIISLLFILLPHFNYFSQTSSFILLSSSK